MLLDDSSFLRLWSNAISIVFSILVLIAIFFSAYDIINFRCQEYIFYQSTIAQGETLQSAINTSDDIINTQLYADAVTYNTDLARLKERSVSPLYSLSFSGKYDWTAIPAITFN